MKIAIIGAGPSGIAAGRELLKQGFTRFTIFDELDAPGGTWRQQSYPGLACDVWAHSYTFSDVQHVSSAHNEHDLSTYCLCLDQPHFRFSSFHLGMSGHPNHVPAIITQTLVVL